MRFAERYADGRCCRFEFERYGTSHSIRRGMILSLLQGSGSECSALKSCKTELSVIVFNDAFGEQIGRARRKKSRNKADPPLGS